MFLPRNHLFQQKGIYPILDIDFCRRNQIQPEDLIELWLSFPALISFFQLRYKSGVDVEYALIYERLAKAFPEIKIIINDRWKLALKYDSYGLHLGKEDFLALNDSDKEKIQSAHFIKGTSSHSLEDLKSLEPGFWDYSGYGPIFPTSTKETENEILGIEGLKKALDVTDLPLVPIGGISVENLESICNLAPFRFASISMAAFKENLVRASSILHLT